MTSDLIVGSLTIEPGTLVCFAEGATLRVFPGARLSALGTGEAQIRLTPAVNGAAWGGILVDGFAIFEHVVVEDADVGIEGGTAAVIDIETSTIRRIRGAAATIGVDGRGTIIDTRIDSACISHCTASPGAVTVLSGATALLAELNVANSGATGIWIGPRTAVTLRGGSIEGSQGIGLHIFDAVGRPAHITVEASMRITENDNYPAHVPLRAAAALLASPEDRSGWRGNRNDTVVATAESGGTADSVTIDAAIAWHILASSAGAPARIQRLYLRPGGRLLIGGPFSGLDVGHLTAVGTQDSLVRIESEPRMGVSNLVIAGDGSSVSRVHFTTFTRTALDLRSDEPVIIQNVHFDESMVRVGAPRTRIDSTTLRGGLDYANAALILAADGVTVSDCTVTQSPQDGIRIEVASEVQVNDCNLTDNEGLAIRNIASDPVDARFNWWGDPAGPYGPGADGVSGNVIFQPFRATPIIR